MTPRSASVATVMDRQASRSTSDQQIPSSAAPTLDQLQPPPSRAFTKNKRKRGYEPYPLPNPVDAAKVVQDQRYWNEYDNPEDLSDDEAYVIFIDPSATWKFPGQATVENAIRRARTVLWPRASAERKPLLSATDDPSNSFHTSDDNTSSLSSEDALSVSGSRAYGTGEGRKSRFSVFRGLRRPRLDMLQRPPQRPEPGEQMPSLASSVQLHHHQREQNKLRLYTTCLSASVVVLVTTLILAATGRKKQRGTVDAGVVFGIVANLLFTIIGVGYMLSRRDRLSWMHRACVSGVFVAVCVGDGGILAWLLT